MVDGAAIFYQNISKYVAILATEIVHLSSTILIQTIIIILHIIETVRLVTLLTISWFAVLLIGAIVIHI
jgi:hypothetical protein